MITNEERKEIAEKLRSSKPTPIGLPCTMARIICRASKGWCKKVDGCDDCVVVILNRLAELIEPTCEMYRDEYGVWHCKSCESGADKIMGSNGEMDEWCASWHPVFCPYCGKKVKS